MAKLTPTQELHLERVRTVRASLREAKSFAEVRARAIALEEIAGHQAALDHEVRLAFNAGIAKLVIRRDGLGTQDSKTLEDILRRTAGAAAALAGKLESDPLANRYEWDGNNLTATLSGLELEDALTEHDWNETVFAAQRLGIDKARFEVNEADGRKWLTVREDAAMPDNRAFLADHGNRHPVIAWMREPNHEAEALEWFETQVAV